jgi:hypothetical protein
MFMMATHHEPLLIASSHPGVRFNLLYKSALLCYLVNTFPSASPSGQQWRPPSRYGTTGKSFLRCNHGLSPTHLHLQVRRPCGSRMYDPHGLRLERLQLGAGVGELEISHVLP